MPRTPINSILAILIALALLLPAVATTLYVVGLLLGLMQDTAGKVFVDYLLLATIFTWMLDLAITIVVVAWQTLNHDQRPPQS